MKSISRMSWWIACNIFMRRSVSHFEKYLEKLPFLFVSLYVFVCFCMFLFCYVSLFDCLLGLCFFVV